MVTLNLRSNIIWNFLFTEYSGLCICHRCNHQLFWSLLNLRSKSFQNIFLYQAVWTLNFSGRVGGWAPTVFCHTKFEVKTFSEFFHLQSALDSEFFRGGGVSGHHLFLDTTNLRLKIFQNFFLYWALWSLNFFWVGLCLIINIFWSCQIWGQKFFRIFSLTEHSVLNIWDDRSGHQIFLVALNLRSNIIWNFFVYRVLWTLYLSQVQSPTFLVTLNLRSKSFQNIFLYQAVWTLNFSGRVGVWAPTVFCHTKFEVKTFSEFFHLQSALDSEFFRRGGVSGHHLFLDTPSLRSKSFQNFFLYWAL